MKALNQKTDSDSWYPELKKSALLEGVVSMDLFQYLRMDLGWNCHKDLEFAVECAMEVADQDWDMLLEEGEMC